MSLQIPRLRDRNAQNEPILECFESERSALEHNPEFLQSAVWAEQKSRFGWNDRIFTIKFSGRDSPLVLLLLLRKIATFHIAYIPHAPSLAVIKELGESPGTLLEAIGTALSGHLPKAIFIRFDLNWNLRQFDGAETGLNESRLLKSSVQIQPPDTVMLDIAEGHRTEDDILSRMKPKTRYNIRLAAKRGVQIRLAEREDCKVPPELADWYKLYQLTGGRNHIALHSQDYYAHLFSITGAAQCRLYLASHEQDLLAGIIVISHGRQGCYLYGASSNLKRAFMPAYALQWRAISDLRREGMNYYDLFGIPPSPSAEHPMFGLYQFKTGFGGEIVHSPGSWDLPLKGPLYSIYRMIERLRMYYYRILKKGRV